MTTESIVWSNLEQDIHVFAVYHDNPPEDIKSEMIIIPNRMNLNYSGNIPFLVTEEWYKKAHLCGRGVVVKKMPVLDDGDIIVYRKKEQVIEVIFQVNSKTNSLFLTSACNSKCQFCPQPPQNDSGEFYEIAKKVIEYVQDGGESVCVTGGEPTLNRESFLSILRLAKEKWPTTKLFILTNGKTFARNEFVKEVFSIYEPTEIGFGIPLYADAATLHDTIVNSPNSFGKTILGLYNLAIHHTEIELRFVFSQLNYKRLPALIDFVGRNLPFVTRVVVMGIEPMGYCRNQWSRFFVDPIDCHEELIKSFKAAKNHNLTMLLYNFQLCCLPNELHQIAYSTISEWKRTYVKECLACSMRNVCGGFFASQNEPQYRSKKFMKLDE